VDVLAASVAPVELPKASGTARALPYLLLMTLAAACGASWSWGAAGALSPLVMVAWWRSQNRFEALLVGAAYQLGTTAGLTVAAALWLDVSVLEAALLIVGVAVGVGACWALLIPSRCSARLAPLAVLLWLVVTVSPIGAGAWMPGHPLAAAGLWCPGAGWVGLVVMVGVFLAARTRMGAAVMVGWGLVAVARAAAPMPVPDVAAVTTESEPAAGTFDFIGQYAVAREAMAQAELEDAQVVLLPEGAAGTWTGPMRDLWAPCSARLARGGRSALVGAVLQGAGQLENVVVGLGRADGQVMRQRLPIPVAMWRPWAEESFAAAPWDSGVLELGGVRAGVLVCWEGALVWPALRSMAGGADALVLLANHGWTGPRAETRRGLEAWGALFGVPVAMAENVWRGR
jgi:hypothetical protein